MANDIYLQLGIDSNKLKRDYIKNPLIWIPKPTGGYSRERPNKEDLKYLYNVLNLEIIKIKKYFNITIPLLYKILNEYNLKKSSKNRKENNIKAMNRLYGVNNQFQRKEIIQKCHTKEIYIKKYNTMKKNNSFNTSKDEKYILNKLKIKFNTILTEYKSEKYPFRCDFYIPEIDTYIEYNGHWTHGFEPYIGTKEQKEKIKLWNKKSKSKNYLGKYKNEYINAINVWTNKDVLKRKTAKLNNLNYFEFFNQTQFLKWYNKL